MADATDQATPSEFCDQISLFLRAVSLVSCHWVRSSGGVGSESFEIAMNNVQAARAARDQINSLAPAVMSSIVSPVGVSPTKFVSGILDDTENAWHLCRFVHCIKPDKVYDDPDSERLREEMHARLPALHNSLRESRDHIGHTLMLGEPVEQGSSGDAKTEPAKGEANGEKPRKTWQAVRSELLNMLKKGMPFTSQPKLSVAIGCSSGTISKAIHKDPECPELKEWALKAKGSATGMKSLDSVDEAALVSSEASPADVVEKADEDKAMEYLLSQARPHEKKKILEMCPADRRELAEVSYRDPDMAEQINLHREKGGANKKHADN
jgi:hypothetical protein